LPCVAERSSLSRVLAFCVFPTRIRTCHAAFSCFCYALGKVPRDCPCALPTGKRTPALVRAQHLRATHSPAPCGLDTVSELTRVCLCFSMAPHAAAMLLNGAQCGGPVLRPYRGRTRIPVYPVSLLLVVRCWLPQTKTARHAAGPRTARYCLMSVSAIQFACLARVLQACVRLSAYPFSNVCASINCLACHVK
jgi:hypothetical protein